MPVAQCHRSGYTRGVQCHNTGWALSRAKWICWREKGRGGEKEKSGGIYYGEWWITRRCTDTPQRMKGEERWGDGRKREKSSRGGSGLAVSGSGLQIAAVKGARFYLFIVGLLKRWWRSDYVSAPQLCYVNWINLWNMSVNNAADIISFPPACVLSHPLSRFLLFLLLLLPMLLLWPW